MSNQGNQGIGMITTTTTIMMLPARQVFLFLLCFLILTVIDVRAYNQREQQPSHPAPPSQRTTATTDHHYHAFQRQLLIGGETAPPHRFPYFVSLEHYCGGVLIAPDIVLTAGHCKPDRHSHVRPAVGRYKWFTSSSMNELDNEDEPKEDEFDPVEYMEIESSHRHPNWTDLGEGEFVHDFAIIKLKESSQNPFVKINRQPRLPHDGQSLLVLGGGNTVSPFLQQEEGQDDDSRSNILQQVTLEAISNSNCEQSHSIERNESYHGLIQDSHLCTGYGIDNQRDSCDYDSGSPILITTKSIFTGRMEDLLVGVVSWGMSCADPDFPGVNARVSDAADWIDEMVCQLSDNPPRDFCRNAAAAAKTMKDRRPWSRDRIPSSVAKIAVFLIVVVFTGLIIANSCRCYYYYCHYCKRTVNGYCHFCCCCTCHRLRDRPLLQQLFGSATAAATARDQEKLMPSSSIKTAADDVSSLSDADSDGGSASSYGSIGEAGVEVI